MKEEIKVDENGEVIESLEDDEDQEEEHLITRERNITAVEERVNTKSTDLATRIADENDGDKLKELIQLFNVNIAKKNILRVNKLNDLVDYISDEMANRIMQDPDSISNKDLKDFLTTAQNTLDKSSRVLDNVPETPTIQVNTQINNFNTPTDELTREQRENVLNIVSAILNNKKNEGNV